MDNISVIQIRRRLMRYVQNVCPPSRAYNTVTDVPLKRIPTPICRTDRIALASVTECSAVLVRKYVCFA